MKTLRIVFSFVVIMALSFAVIPTVVHSYPSTSDSVPFWTPPGGICAYDSKTGAWRPVAITSGGAANVEIRAPYIPPAATWTVTTTAASWTLSASATDFSLFHIGTHPVWIQFNAGGATVSQCIPLLPGTMLSRMASPGTVVWGISTATQVIIKHEGQ